MAIGVMGVPPIQQFPYENPYLMGMQQGNQLSQGYLQNIASALANQKAAAELPYAGPLAEANAKSKLAYAEYMNSPLQYLKNLSPFGKNYLEPFIINNLTGKLEKNPDFNPSISNQNLSNQNNVNPNVETGQQNATPTRNIFEDYQALRQKTYVDPVTRRNALAAQQLMHEINGVDVNPLTKFTGIAGKAKELYGKGQIAGILPGQPSQDLRDYLKWKNGQRYVIMDTVRKVLSTSVVPGYVKETILPFTDPTSSIWNDPEQVKQNWKLFKDWANSYVSGQTGGMKYVPELSDKNKENMAEFLQNKQQENQESELPDKEVYTYNPMTGRLE